MKNIKTLQSIINILYIILMIFFYFACIGTAFAIFTGHVNEVDPCNNSQFIDFRSLGTILFTIFTLGLFFMFTRAILALKRTMPSLVSGEIFSGNVANNLEKAGKIFVITGIGLFTLQFMGNLLIRSEIKIGIDSFSLTSIFLVIIGLFFTFFGEAFVQAKTLQQENDLTI